MNRIPIIAFLFILLIRTASAQSTPAIPLLNGIGIDQHLNNSIPVDAAFTDETNSPVQLKNLLRAKPVILVLVQYRCPSLCSVVLNDMLSTLKVVPQNIGTDYDVWTVSFDPTEHTDLARSKKTGYVNTYLRTRPEAADASAGWHFLTGDEANIHALTESVGFHYRYDIATQQYIHPAALILLTPDGKISRYFFGIDYNPTDLRLSLVEASNGKIGTLTDQLLLFCYHYDPATGRYGLAVMNTLKLSAVLTIVLLSTGFLFLWRADKRRTQRLLALAAKGAAP